MTQEKAVVLVTGAGRGIGKAILLKLAKPGAIAIGVDYNKEGVQAINDFLKERGCLGEGFTMDVTQPSSIAEVMEEIYKKYGAVSILVNNAGITKDNLFMRMSSTEWDQVLATNLTSVFNVSRACIRDMVKARWGRIINITSVVGCAGNAGQTNYAASKAGIIGFSKSLAMEVASRGITVNCVAPGFIETAMTEQLSEEQRSQLLTTVPMKRMGSIDDVANAVEFLASEKASYVTGMTMHVNGGMYMI